MLTHKTMVFVSPQVFKERIAAFREAVYLLTGYKVDMNSNSAATGSDGSRHPQLRLRSMYAEAEEVTGAATTPHGRSAEWRPSHRLSCVTAKHRTICCSK